MKKALTALSLSLVATTAALSEEKRELGAHEHGVGALNIAIDGTAVAMEFHAPGADIVGFEYEAKSDEDLAKIDAAISTLSAPQALFVLPSEAGCSLTNASVSLESEENHSDHGDHEHEDHAEHDHGHDDHKDEDHAEHDHGHDDHIDEDHAVHDHGQDAGHTEFHAEYAMTCDNPDALTSIEFAYFETFANAQEIEVQIVSSSGAQAYEVERDSPTLFLGS